ncbi:MAG: PA domain-containing protein [Saprospiraceae bacterium]
MKQNFTKLTLLFAAFLLNASLYGQFYNVSIDGVDGEVLALGSSLPGPCIETFSGEVVAGTPADGCAALTNPDDLAGKIAVLDRGSCNFTDKIQYAQDAGAIAVIVCNNRPESEEGGGILVMGGDDPGTIDLFAVMISQEQCVTLKANLPAQVSYTVAGFEETPAEKVLWGNEPGQGDFDGGLNEWRTVTVSCNGAATELDTWKYDADGILDGGALSIGTSPGPTFCNGMMAFDSDFLDNEGGILNPDGSINNGAVGTGPCPAPQVGELISPIIDISGFDAAGISLEFYQETRQLNSQYFVEYSINGGESYDFVEINTEIDGNAFNEMNKTFVPLPDAAGSDSLRIKFTYFGNYYYWLIDDVKIIEREANNLRVNENFYAAAPNVRVPKSQVDGINFLADIQNIGASTQENTTLSISVTDDATGEEVYSDATNLGTITADSLTENNLLPNKFTPAAEVAQYTGIYTVSAEAADTDLSDNTQTINFEVTENEFANEDGTNLGNVAISDVNQIPTWSIGNYFYLPKGNGYKVSGFGIGIGNADAVGGLEVGVRMFKWTDVNADSDESGFPEAGPDERELVGFADYEILGNELPEDINVIGAAKISSAEDGEGAPILLEDDAHYLVMMTMDSEVGVSAKDDLYTSYLAMNLASTTAGAPRYWSFFGNSAEIDETVYDANNSFTPLVRMYILPEGVSAVTELSADNLIAVTPNPASDFVNLSMDFTKSFDNVNIMMTDITGRVVLMKDLDNVRNHQMRIDVGNLMSGTFILNITTPDGVRTEKFVKVD